LCVQGRTDALCLLRLARRGAPALRQAGGGDLAEQHAALQATQRQGAANGVALSWLDADAARALEPALSCSAALLSPETGIVDSHGLMLALQGDLERHGGALALQSPVLGVQCGSDAHVVEVGGEMPISLSARIVVNAAGLWAPGLAAAERGLPGAQRPQAFYAKGNYFSLALLQRLPAAQDFVLVRAGTASCRPSSGWRNPVAEVQVRQPSSQRGLLDLPQHVVGAVAGAASGS
jgi:hypothetical protein